MQTHKSRVGTICLVSAVMAVGAAFTPARVLGAEGERQLVLQAGHHDRAMVPMSIDAPAGLENPRMDDVEANKEVPCQLADGKLWWIIDKLAAGQSKTYRVTSGGQVKPAVEVVKDGRFALDVKIAGKPLTTFRFDPNVIRPYCYPLFGPGQIPLTRGYPMENKPGEPRDHNHHRSFWVAYGELNPEKFNFWMEAMDKQGKPKDKEWDRQVTQDVKSGSGPVFGWIDAVVDWTAHTGKKILQEDRRLKFYAIDNSARVIDMIVTFKAKYGDVLFLDTKEGGICSLRLAEEMQEIRTVRGKPGGRITNSDGLETERKTWGKRAKWCDYSCTQERQYGIAVFDTPGNFRYPTWWHVRGYGLFCANPFGIHSFDAKSAEKGDYTLENGKELTFRYRLLLHRGDVKTGQVAARYEDYVAPPTAAWK